MKKFKCKETELRAELVQGEGVKQLHYGDLINLLFNTPIDKDDQTYLAIKKAFNFLDKFEGKKLNDVVELEDVDVKFAKERAMKFNFPFRHRDIIKFVDYISSLDNE